MGAPLLGVPNTGGTANMMSMDVTRLGALANLDAWLDTMHVQYHYSGPVSHWWESGLIYAGPLYDWRYEGLVDGYLTLYTRTSNPRFLDKAIAAGNVLISQQLPDGRFRRSSFQFGPIAGGTPHEASVDVALLLLSLAGLDSDGRFLDSATKNLDRYWVKCLWDGTGFRDQPDHPVYVANKHGTLLEALILHSRLTGREWTTYVDACRTIILRTQATFGPQYGGCVHAGIGASKLAIPIYTARALNGLLSYRDWRRTTIDDDAIRRGADFLLRHIRPGGVAWGTYGTGQRSNNPVMVAGAGDVLRFLWRLSLTDLGNTNISKACESISRTLVTQQQPSGGIPTARGFSRKGLAYTPSLPEFRDVLPVVGWVDKTFRALALMIPSGSSLPAAAPVAYHTEVSWQGQRLRYTETSDSICMRDRHHIRFLWEKNSPVPKTLVL